MDGWVYATWFLALVAVFGGAVGYWLGKVAESTAPPRCSRCGQRAFVRCAECRVKDYPA